MKTKIPFKKLDMRGFAHDVGLVIFVVIFAIAGVGYLVATHADSCHTGPSVSGYVLYSENGDPATTCQPASGPTSGPVSTSTGSGEQLSIPPARRPVQYVHRCSTTNVAEYDTQGTPNCLPGGKFLGDYPSTVPGTYYNVPCKTVNSNTVRYAYVSATDVCPSGTVRVLTSVSSGEQLSQPPQRRPAQYVHVCSIGNTIYVTQGMPNCLSGGTFRLNYAPSVPGTYYSTPCATTNGNSNSVSPLRYAYISSNETCPAGTVSVSKN